MKKLFLFAAAATMFAACSKDTTEDINVLPENVPPHDVLQVSVGDEDESRIQLDNGKTVWTQGDKVSVFYKTTGNECYQFTGNTGDTRGSIMKVSGSAGATAIDKNIVIYPYNKDYELDLMNNTASVVIPSTQRYVKNSYGVGANVMIASSSNNSFTLRNICGWLKLQFTGNAIINAIKIKGNNNEQLAGTAIANYEDFSTFLYGNLANSGDDIGGIILPPGEYAREITLDCGTGLMLSDVPTEFYIAVAPQTLSKGISITAECYGNISKIEKSTGKSITIARNHIVPVANIDIDVPVPNKCILYTSSDGKIVTPYDSSAFGFGATIVSNTYNNGIGMIVFNQNIWRIDNNAFKGCTKLTSITIPDSVASIGDSAFSSCYNLTAFYGKYASADNRCYVINGKLVAFAPYGLTEYVIPDGVTSIGDYTFYGCSRLTSINIPDSVTSIGDYAFQYCDNLTSITIGNSVASIGEYAFYGCSSLTSINIPDSVTSIGNYAFYDCRDLKSITIPNSVTSIGDRAFSNCSGLTSITIPDGVTSIGEYAFSGCRGLTSITIPDGVTSIGNSAFYYCSSLTSVTISDSVASIGEYAFYGCSSLTSINIPDSVTSIGNYAFYDCSSLNSVYITDIAKWYAIEFGNFYSNPLHCVANLYLNGKLFTDLVIPDGITSIGSTFSGCSSLKSVIIPDSVTSIGYEAFYGCSSLTSVNIPDSVTSIGNYAFSGCSSLTSITIPDGVTSIGNSAFEDCSSMTSINIPDSVTSIGNYAFSGCSSLTSITIPDGVISIGSHAFENCTGECIINCNIKNGSSNSSPFNNAKFTKITIGNSVTSIGFYAFYLCTSLKSINIPDSITSIEESAFKGCTSLTSVYITDIAKWCAIEFKNGDSNPLNYADIYLNGELVKDLAIPDGVISIGSYAFYGYSNLTSIAIPDSVTSIGEYAFYNCRSLTNIYCKPITPPSLNWSTFCWVSSSAKIYVPTASVDAYKSATKWSSYASMIEGYDF